MTTAVVCPEKTVWALLVSNRHAHVSIIISWQRSYMKKPLPSVESPLLKWFFIEQCSLDCQTKEKHIFL